MSAELPLPITQTYTHLGTRHFVRALSRKSHTHTHTPGDQAISKVFIKSSQTINTFGVRKFCPILIERTLTHVWGPGNFPDRYRAFSLSRIHTRAHTGEDEESCPGITKEQRKKMGSRFDQRGAGPRAYLASSARVKSTTALAVGFFSRLPTAVSKTL